MSSSSSARKWSLSTYTFVRRLRLSRGVISGSYHQMDILSHYGQQTTARLLVGLVAVLPLTNYTTGTDFADVRGLHSGMWRKRPQKQLNTPTAKQDGRVTLLAANKGR